MRIIDLATGTATSADNIAIDSSSGGTRKVPFLSTVNALIAAGISALSSAVSALSTRVGSVETAVGQRLLVWTGQLTASVSCPAGATTAVFSAYDVSDYLPDGATLKAATVGWTTDNLIPVNTQVIGGKLYVYLYNYKSAAVTVSNVAVQLFYTV